MFPKSRDLDRGILRHIAGKVVGRPWPVVRNWLKEEKACVRVHVCPLCSVKELNVNRNIKIEHSWSGVLRARTVR